MADEEVATNQDALQPDAATEGEPAATMNDSEVRPMTDSEVRSIQGDVFGRRLGERMIRYIDLQVEYRVKHEEKDRKLIAQRDEDFVVPVSKDRQCDCERCAAKETISDGPACPSTLFAHAAARAAVELGQASAKDALKFASKVPQISSPAFTLAIFQLVRLPYPVVAAVLRLAQLNKDAADSAKTTSSSTTPVGTCDNIDDWIVSNEIYMRARLVLDQASSQEQREGLGAREDNSALEQLGIDRTSSHWSRYLVALGRDGPKVFGTPSGSSPDSVTIQRPSDADLPGFRVLDERRKNEITIRTLSAFHDRFDRMTGGSLKRLDWRHVLVAGALVLGSLTSFTDAEESNYQSSTVDTYVPLRRGPRSPYRQALRNREGICRQPARRSANRLQIVVRRPPQRGCGNLRPRAFPTPTSAGLPQALVEPHVGLAQHRPGPDSSRLQWRGCAHASPCCARARDRIHYLDNGSDPPGDSFTSPARSGPISVQVCRARLWSADPAIVHGHPVRNSGFRSDNNGAQRR